jgi:catechol 2,3-dioxygenase-like lactoylglutathione lyase family enzyme
MAGLVFLGTRDLKRIKEFYTSEMEMEIWLEQAECFIVKHENLLLGFCQRDKADIDGVFTLFFNTNEEVDRFHKKFLDTAEGAPTINERYRIYHFYAKDPDGRRIEFQRFLQNIPPI